MKSFITTILLLALFTACKKGDDSTTPFSMSCPTKAVPIYFSYQGAGVVLPSGFTPNGDGKNDVLRFFGFDSATVKAMTLRVVDGTGNTLFTTTTPFKGWDGMNTSTGKPYPTAQYRIEYDGILNGKGLKADSTVKGHTCVWLFGQHPTQTGCVQAPSDVSILNDIKFEDQFDPFTLASPYTTAENFCP